MTTRPVPSRRPVPSDRAAPARTAAGVLAFATLLVVATTWAILRAPAPAPLPGPVGDVYLSGAILTRFVTPGNAGAVRDGRFEFVHAVPPFPLRILAELPPRGATGDGYIADATVTVELLGEDGAPVRRFTAPLGSVAATADEIVLNGRLFDERGETLWLAARFAH